MMTTAKRLAACAAALGLAVVTSNAAFAAKENSSGKLGQHGEQLLLQAQQAGKSRVILLIAVKSGASNQAVSDIARLGGQIQFRDDAIGYLRASVPVSQVRLSQRSLRFSSWTSMSPCRSRSASGRCSGHRAAAAADRGDASHQPIHHGETGRTVRSGESDLGRPRRNDRCRRSRHHSRSPQPAVTSTGKRKVVDWVTGTDPFTDDDPTWLNMSAQVSGTHLFSAASRIPRRRRAVTGLRCSTSATRGSPVKSATTSTATPTQPAAAAPLLSSGTRLNLVWVDTNQNNSFADQAAMTDYKVRFDIGYFGVDNPATAIAERMPFVVRPMARGKSSISASCRVGTVRTSPVSPAVMHCSAAR